MQCMLAVSPRFLGPDNTPLVVLNLSEPYPTMELQAIVPEVLKKIVTTYDMVSPLGPDLGEQIEGFPVCPAWAYAERVSPSLCCSGRQFSYNFYNSERNFFKGWRVMERELCCVIQGQRTTFRTCFSTVWSPGTELRLTRQSL